MIYDWPTVLLIFLAAWFFGWSLGSVAFQAWIEVKWKLLSLKLLYWAWKDARNDR